MSNDDLRDVRDTDGEEVATLLAVVDEICMSEAENTHKRHALEQLCLALRPRELHEDQRRTFVRRAMARGIVSAAVQLIELGVTDLACAASNFLGDFAFNSDTGARAVLEVFDRIAACFKHIFADLTWEHLPLLDAAILLCVNVAATCPSGHSRLVPLVRPVCLQIIKHPTVSDKLRGNTILLLANLSMTVGHELRSLRVADVLLDLVIENRQNGAGRSVAESVIIFLHGSQECWEVDELMHMGVVSEYCVPIMERTLGGAEFRGMYPHLLYSAQLFQVLSQCERYAKALAADPKVIPLLLRVSHAKERPVRVESDLEGRRLALEALWSLARFGLWPSSPEEDLNSSADVEMLSAEETLASPGSPSTPASSHIECSTFLAESLPELLRDNHIGIRTSAVGLWACLNASRVTSQMLIGQRLEVEGRLPAGLWRTRILTWLYPFLGVST